MEEPWENWRRTVKLRGHSTEAIAAVVRDVKVKRRRNRWGESDIEIDLGFGVSLGKKRGIGIWVGGDGGSCFFLSSHYRRSLKMVPLGDKLW